MSATEDPVVDRILRMFDAWGESNDAMRQSLFDNFTDDCVWENPGFPAAVGPQAGVELVIAPARERMAVELIRVITLRITHQDGLVWTERIDDLLRADGSVVLSALLAGVMQVDADGRIRAWREYSRHLDAAERAALGDV